MGQHNEIHYARQPWTACLVNKWQKVVFGTADNVQVQRTLFG